MGSMTLLGCGRASATVGPPTFSWTADDNVWTGTGTATITSSADAIGAASATRRVVVIGRISNGNPYVLTGGTIGGVTIDTTFSDNATDASNAWFLASAIVPTGTTATVVLTFTGGGIFGPICSIFTVDNSQLSGPTSPVTAIGIASATTTLTKTIAVLAGGSILASCNGSGTSTVPQITSSTATFTNDGTISNFYSSGHANGASANVASSVTETWTGSAAAGLLLVAYR